MRSTPLINELDADKAVAQSTGFSGGLTFGTEEAGPDPHGGGDDSGNRVSTRVESGEHPVRGAQQSRAGAWPRLLPRLSSRGRRLPQAPAADPDSAPLRIRRPCFPPLRACAASCLRWAATCCLRGLRTQVFQRPVKQYARDPIARAFRVRELLQLLFV